MSPFILLSFASVKEFYQYEKNHYAGHAGDLVRTRLAEAVTTIAYPELMPEYELMPDRPRLSGPRHGRAQGFMPGVRPQREALLPAQRWLVARVECSRLTR